MTAEDNKVGLREYSLYKADYFVPIYITLSHDDFRIMLFSSYYFL